MKSLIDKTNLQAGDTLQETCPCCGSHLHVHGIQDMRPYFDKVKVLIHCMDEDCALYKATTTNIQEAWKANGYPEMRKG